MKKLENAKLRVAIIASELSEMTIGTSYRMEVK